MPPSVRCVLLERVVEANSQGQEDTDRRPEPRPDQEPKTPRRRPDPRYGWSARSRITAASPAGSSTAWTCRARPSGYVNVASPDIAVQREVVEAFLAAAREGDFQALLRVLDPDVAVRIDGGPKAPRPFARPPIVGAQVVAAEITGPRGAVGATFEPVMVNGAPGLLVRYPARSVLAAFTVTNGRIVESTSSPTRRKFEDCERDTPQPCFFRQASSSAAASACRRCSSS